MTLLEFMSDSPYLTFFIVLIIGMTIEAVFKTLFGKKKETK
jgi:hypothetical protein